MVGTKIKGKNRDSKQEQTSPDLEHRSSTSDDNDDGDNHMSYYLLKAFYVAYLICIFTATLQNKNCWLPVLSLPSPSPLDCPEFFAGPQEREKPLS